MTPASIPGGALGFGPLSSSAISDYGPFGPAPITGACVLYQIQDSASSITNADIATSGTYSQALQQVTGQALLSSLSNVVSAQTDSMGGIAQGLTSSATQLIQDLQTNLIVAELQLSGSLTLLQNGNVFQASSDGAIVAVIQSSDLFSGNGSPDISAAFQIIQNANISVFTMTSWAVARTTSNQAPETIGADAEATSQGLMNGSVVSTFVGTALLPVGGSSDNTGTENLSNSFNATGLAFIAGSATLSQLANLLLASGESRLVFIDGNNNIVKLSFSEISAFLEGGNLIAFCQGDGTVVLLEPILGASNAAN